MKIKLATDGDKIRWNDYCDQQVNLPPLSRFEWKYVLEETYGVKVFLIMALDEQVCGILPVYEIKDYSGNTNIYSLKFGLVADNTRVSGDLVRCAHQFSQERNANRLTIFSGYDQYEFDESPTIAKTVTLIISPSEDEMWQNISGKARNMVRKSRKDGATVEQGVNNLDEFYSIYSNRMLQKGVRIHSLVYFEEIIKYNRHDSSFFGLPCPGHTLG
jgi:hypothetical protein